MRRRGVRKGRYDFRAQTWRWNLRLTIKLGLILAALVVSSLGSPPVSANAACLALPGLDDKCETWVSETGFADSCCDFVENPAARAIAASMTTVVYSVPVNDPGQPAGQGRWDFETVAVNTSDGSRRWTRRFSGPSDGWDVPLSVVISPDGTTVYVSGYRDYPSSPNVVGSGGCDYEPASALTLAYDLATGQELWRYGFETPSGLDAGFSSTVSPDGTQVHVAGLVAGAAPQSCDFDMGVVTLDANTGEELWRRTMSGAGLGFDAAYAVSSVSDGSRLIVGGVQSAAGSGADFTTIALDARDDPEDKGDAVGAILWRRVETNPGADRLNSLVVSRDGKRAFATGEYAQPGISLFPNTVYGTFAYDVASGSRSWASTYSTSTDGPSSALGLAIRPQGDRLFVTGRVSNATEVTWEYATVAYDASTGVIVWDKQYRDPVTAFEEGADILASPDGDVVYVTGHAGHPSGQGDAATIAYSALDGTEMWVGRLNGSTTGSDYTQGLELATTPDGAWLFALGSTAPTAEPTQATVAGRPSDPVRGLVWAYRTD